jgi:hypothetical protein
MFIFSIELMLWYEKIVDLVSKYDVDVGMMFD